MRAGFRFPLLFGTRSENDSFFLLTGYIPICRPWCTGQFDEFRSGLDYMVFPEKSDRIRNFAELLSPNQIY
jgi:hypothetical protein